jgi:5-formyltetrahydrofolate cyclo-ligase
MTTSKNHLRTQMKIMLGSLLSKDRRKACSNIADIGEDFLSSEGRKIIAGFYPVGDQITPLLLMQALFRKQMSLALPKLDDQNEMRFYSWWPGARLKTAEGAIPEPEDTSEELSPDYLLVPLLGFDRMGNRLGHGNGFYTQAINSVRSRQNTVIVGVGFSEQELGLILDNDAEGRLDWIITEKGLRGLTH